MPFILTRRYAHDHLFFITATTRQVATLRLLQSSWRCSWLVGRRSRLATCTSHLTRTMDRYSGSRHTFSNRILCGGEEGARKASYGVSNDMRLQWKLRNRRFEYEGDGLVSHEDFDRINGCRPFRSSMGRGLNRFTISVQR